MGGTGRVRWLSRPGGLELPVAESAGRGRDVNDSHLLLCLVTRGHPERLTGGYLYHLRMAAAAPRHDARIVFISFPERSFPLPALVAPRLMRRTRRLGAHAILLDSIAAAFAAPALVASPHRAPIIGILHQPPGGIDHGRARTAAQARLDRVAYRAAQALIVPSTYLGEQLVAGGLDRARVHVVPPGRDVAPALTDAADLRRGRQAALLCVANWLEHKGIIELLEAVARLPPETVMVHLVGDEAAKPAYGDRVRRRISRADLADRVVTHGTLSPDRVARLYASADVFVLPAFRESYGIVWGDAMAFGLPVVGWRAGNLPYLARDGHEGLLVAPGDVDALSRALERVATDAKLRSRLGAAARRRASARPTWEESAAMFFAAIRSSL